MRTSKPNEYQGGWLSIQDSLKNGSVKVIPNKQMCSSFIKFRPLCDLSFKSGIWCHNKDAWHYCGNYHT